MNPQPTDFNKIIKLGEDCLKDDKQFDRTNMFVEGILRVVPDNSAALCFHGEALRLKKNYSAAFQEFNKVLLNEPNNKYAFEHRETVLIELVQKNQKEIIDLIRNGLDPIMIIKRPTFLSSLFSWEGSLLDYALYDNKLLAKEMILARIDYKIGNPNSHVETDEALDMLAQYSENSNRAAARLKLDKQIDSQVDSIKQYNEVNKEIDHLLKKQIQQIKLSSVVPDTKTEDKPHNPKI